MNFVILVVKVLKMIVSHARREERSSEPSVNVMMVLTRMANVFIIVMIRTV